MPILKWNSEKRRKKLLIFIIEELIETFGELSIIKYLTKLQATLLYFLDKINYPEPSLEFLFRGRLKLKLIYFSVLFSDPPILRGVGD
jgi:hypothetical protein